MTNQRQLARAMHLYTDENNDIFPAHRNNNGISTEPNITNWWGPVILAYASGGTNVFRCSHLNQSRVENNIRWNWRFDMHSVGYGYNAFFLGLHPYQAQPLTLGGIRFDAAPWFKRNLLVRPAQNLLLADRAPISSPPTFTSVLWWPASGSSANQGREGVSTRHARKGVVVFNDGHVELRPNDKINPPVDPNSGNPNALINSHYWDPLQRKR